MVLFTYMTEIVIPSWNQSQLAVACLQSIRQHTTDYRLIFVDNGSDADEFAVIQAELQQHPHLLVRNRRNLGFVKAVNQGLVLSSAEYVVLLNNDTEVAPDWIAKLQAPFVDSRVAAVGPVTTTADCWQGREPVRKGYRLISATSMLAFFCVMFNRRTINDVGLLDEEYGVGLADDDDYCRRIHDEGYHLALAQNLLIQHHHRSTFKQLYSDADIEALTQRGLDLFYQKHPKRRYGAATN